MFRAVGLLVILFAFARCDDTSSPPAASSPAAAPGTIEFIVAAADRIAVAKDVAPEPGDPRLSDLETLMQDERYADARALLEQIQRDEPNALCPAFLIGLTHHKEKRYSQAAPIFERVLAAGPTFPKPENVLYFYGWAQFYLGKLDLARAAFEATLRLNPNVYDAQFGIGLCDLDDGALDAAEQRFKAVIIAAEVAYKKGDRAAPKDAAKAHARLGDVCEQRNDLPGARGRYEACVTLDKSAYEAWYRLSKVLTRQGETEKAAIAMAQADHWHAERQTRNRRPTEDER